jgi:hypothetical protein
MRASRTRLPAPTGRNVSLRQDDPALIPMHSSPRETSRGGSALSFLAARGEGTTQKRAGPLTVIERLQCAMSSR